MEQMTFLDFFAGIGGVPTGLLLFGAGRGGRVELCTDARPRGSAHHQV